MGADSVIASLQYPTMSVDTKVNSFDVDELLELQKMYLRFNSMKKFRRPIAGDKDAFDYPNIYLENMIRDIDNLINKLK